MKESVISDEVLSLGAFSASRTTEKEEDVWLGENSVVLLFFLR
jgi:hypothetical protein